MSRPARICIITPGALGSNPRVVKEAQALSEAGYHVAVISTRTLDLVDVRDDSVLERARWESKRIDLRSRVRWTAIRVVQLGCRCMFTTGIATLAGWSLSPFSQILARAAAKTPADLYIAHYPPALVSAAAAARRYSALYAFDAEDFHLGDLTDDPAHETERALLRRVEARYLPDCAYVTAASPGIADAYVEAYGIARPTVVLNVFPRSQQPPGATAAGTAVPGPSLYWFSQTIGPNRGLECAVRAIGRAHSRPHLYLRGTPADAYLDQLRAVAREAGVLDRVHILPPAPPDEMELLAAQHDLGLIGETGYTRNRRVALTNKHFSYLLAGLPIVASDVPSHVALAPDLGAAIRLYAVDEPESLADQLDRLLSDPAALREAREQAWRLGHQRFNWDFEKNAFLNCVDVALGAERRPRLGADERQADARL